MLGRGSVQDISYSASYPPIIDRQTDIFCGTYRDTDKDGKINGWKARKADGGKTDGTVPVLLRTNVL